MTCADTDCENTILQGHVLTELNRIPDNSIHCCVTSPPYWGLRDYGLEPVIWPDGWRGQLGLEPDLHQYIAHLVEVFREVRRVLHPSGVLFLNLGDSYAGNSSSSGEGEIRPYSTLNGGKGVQPYEKVHGQRRVVGHHGLKPKDLCLIPARVAIALQDNGWWVRSDIIWAKDNPMPESVTDRPTKSHEYIFLLTKRGRYFWDADAVREAASSNLKSGNFGPNSPVGTMRNDVGRPRGDHTNGRNIRTIWRINPQSFPDTHFATFPSALVERCIKAGTSAQGVCGACLSPWERVVKKVASSPGQNTGYLAATKMRNDGGRAGHFLDMQSTFINWQPTCQCPPAEPVPAVVLDPFLGSGTTAAVAKSMGRNWLGIELNSDYVKMAWQRINAAQPALIPAGIEGCSLKVPEQLSLDLENE